MECREYLKENVTQKGIEIWRALSLDLAAPFFPECSLTTAVTLTYSFETADAPLLLTEQAPPLCAEQVPPLCAEQAPPLCAEQAPPLLSPAVLKVFSKKTNAD